MTKKGRPSIPEDEKAIKFHISLPPELHNMILIVMKKEMLSKSGAIAYLLKKALKNYSEWEKFY